MKIKILLILCLVALCCLSCAAYASTEVADLTLYADVEDWTACSSYDGSLTLPSSAVSYIRLKATASPNSCQFTFSGTDYDTPCVQWTPLTNGMYEWRMAYYLTESANVYLVMLTFTPTSTVCIKYRSETVSQSSLEEQYQTGYDDGYYNGYNQGYAGALSVTELNLLDASKFTSSQSINGVSFLKNSNGFYTVDGTATANTYYYFTSVSISEGHVYALFPNFSYIGRVFLGVINYDVITGTVYQNTGTILNTIGSGNALFFISVPNGVSVSDLIVDPFLYDLTALFGAGNEPATIEEYNRYVNFALDNYYLKTKVSSAYSQGQSDALNTRSTALEMITKIGTIVPDFINSTFNFEILGFNVATLIKFVLTVCLIIFVAKILHGGE